ncbi:uncharacterized protein C8Q71DRAFT_411152 [Rhodofomes roseus]|uniref:Uncharacterized protein n=1 Tax=Rhodofomes roseus TaxID=34475 RepID=A0ABQ8KPU0_9APHY|nr:uncharacterized protein C8Q71DRAFT_411152 [Rhodofomes roseus]KAH9840525.1 hypothetical protein C8Q71DRAFT_411152 [Rhodofomes roseus]
MPALVKQPVRTFPPSPHRRTSYHSQADTSHLLLPSIRRSSATGSHAGPTTQIRVNSLNVSTVPSGLSRPRRIHLDVRTSSGAHKTKISLHACYGSTLWARGYASWVSGRRCVRGLSEHLSEWVNVVYAMRVLRLCGTMVSVVTRARRTSVHLGHHGTRMHQSRNEDAPSESRTHGWPRTRSRRPPLWSTGRPPTAVGSCSAAAAHQSAGRSVSGQPCLVDLTVESLLYARVRVAIHIDVRVRARAET